MSYECEIRATLKKDRPAHGMNTRAINLGRRADKELEAKNKVIARMTAVLTETQELLKGGSNGSSAIVDTVWSNSTPNTTLYELIELTKDKG